MFNQIRKPCWLCTLLRFDCVICRHAVALKSCKLCVVVAMSADHQATLEARHVEAQARLALAHAFVTNTEFQEVAPCDISGPEQFTATHPIATRALELLQEHFDALSSSDENLFQQENVKGCLLMLLDSQDMIDFPDRLPALAPGFSGQNGKKADPKDYDGGEAMNKNNK